MKAEPEKNAFAPFDEQKENELRSAASKGDENALGELLGLYEPLLSGLVRKYKGPDMGTEDVKDMRQEAQIAFCRAVKTYDRTGGAHFGRYAKVCTRNALVSYLRKIRPHARVRLEDMESRAQPAEAGDGEDRRKKQLLAQASPEWFSPFEWEIWIRYRQGRKPGDISRELGRSEKSVYNAVCRIRRKLKQRMSEKTQRPE